MVSFSTSDLCDRYGDSHHLQIAEPLFLRFGAHAAFSGQVSTLKVFEDDVLIRRTLEESVRDRVLVIDGGGSHRCALLDGSLTELGCRNGWQGIILYGCVRDSVKLNQLPIGIRALHTHPLGSHHRGSGNRDSPVTVAGVNFRSGYFIYVDEDGIVVSERPLI